MSKANQAFKQNDEAVSPVIGVILMVAITVVLAAVVFVLVSNLGKGTEQAENASATVSSPSSGIIEITLVRVGENAPYDNSDAVVRNDYDLTINGEECDLGAAADTDGSPSYETGVAGPAALSAGSVLRITGSDPTGMTTTAGACADAFGAGNDNVSVVFSVAGTAILSTTVDVRTT